MSAGLYSKAVLLRTLLASRSWNVELGFSSTSIVRFWVVCAPGGDEESIKFLLLKIELCTIFSSDFCTINFESFLANSV